jgi:phosphonatase-like hydrolase
MSVIELVVFDIAGTTVRDSGNVAHAFIAAFREFGFAIPPVEVKKVMGFRKMDAITLLLEKFAPAHQRDELLIDRIHTRFVDTMIAYYRDDSNLAPMPGAETLFAHLQNQGIKVALNTGFTRSITDTILHRLRWDDRSELIDKTICSDEVANGRPHPDMIKSLMVDLGIASSDRVLKIGDTEVDVKEGRNAGCGIVVSITTGAYTREQLEAYHPDFIVDALSGLLPIIELASIPSV